MRYRCVAYTHKRTRYARDREERERAPARGVRSRHLRGVRPVAYVYPILAFLRGTYPRGASPPWIVPGTYALDGDQLLITRSVTMTAVQNASAVIDAGGASRVLEVDTAAAVSLVGLNITGGYVEYPDIGGGLLISGGAVTVAGCNIYSNFAVSVRARRNLSHIKPHEAKMDAPHTDQYSAPCI